MLAVASGVGPGLGQGLAGFVGHVNWRLPFEVLSLVGLFVFFLLCALLKEPEPSEKVPDQSGRSKSRGAESLQRR